MNRGIYRRRRAIVALAAGSVALVATLAVFVGSGTAAPAQAPENQARPTISGTPQEGKVLTAEPGTWSGQQPIDFSYQWRRCNTRGEACSNISGATDKIYTVGSADVGRRLRVLVTAANSEGASTAQSRATDVVTAQPAEAPTLVGKVTITGTLRVGEKLTAHSSWRGTAVIDVNYRWRRCDEKGSDCRFIAGATTQTYTLTELDAGQAMRVLATATNTAGKTEAVSDPTGVVQPKAKAVQPTPPAAAVDISNVALPDRLIVDRVEFVPSRIRSRNEPLIARFHVRTTRGSAVRNALVLAVGVPFNRLSNEPEVRTDAGGWATIEFRVLPTFALRPGNFVVVFVRARKPGENPLAGVSTRRLVSVRVGA